jgi:hypothetical protein
MDRAALIHETSLSPGALAQTPLVPNHSGRNRMIFVPDWLAMVLISDQTGS